MELGGVGGKSGKLAHRKSSDTTKEDCKLSFSLSVENRFLVSGLF